MLRLLVVLAVSTIYNNCMAMERVIPCSNTCPAILGRNLVQFRPLEITDAQAISQFDYGPSTTRPTQEQVIEFWCNSDRVKKSIADGSMLIYIVCDAVHGMPLAMLYVNTDTSLIGPTLAHQIKPELFKETLELVLDMLFTAYPNKECWYLLPMDRSLQTKESYLDFGFEEGEFISNINIHILKYYRATWYSKKQSLKHQEK